jgi:oligopeptidase B
MPRTRLFLAALLLAACTETPPAAPPPAPAPPPPTSASAASPSADPAPPVAYKRPHVVTLANGDKLDDPYFWLREKDTPDVQTHLLQENTYAEKVLAPLEPLRQRLADEMRARVVEDDTDVPYKEGAYLYYRRVEKGKQHSIHCRKPVKGGDAAKEEILLDLNEIAKTERYVGVGPREVSDDGNLLAYGLDTVGFRQFVLHFKDLKSGKELPERMERVTSVAFSRDGRFAFYTQEDATTKRSHKVFRHRLGTPAASDALLYEEKDERFDVHAERTRSRALVLFTSESKRTTEVRFARADRPEDPLVVVEPREQGHEYFVEHRGDELYVLTNSPSKPGGPPSPNFRLVTARLDKPGRAGWEEIVPHRDDVMLETISAFSTFAVVRERVGGVRTLRVFPGKKLAPASAYPVAMTEPVYALRGESNPEMDATTYRFKYESPTTPETIFDLDPKKRTLDMKKRVTVPGFDGARYEARRAFATAADGTKIPISIVHKKGIAQDGKNPVLLYGYGSYGYPQLPGFSASLISLLDRGVVYAVAHVRGGGEMGKRWHDGARMMTKRNTFTDFIAVAEGLVADKWADPRRIVIQGRSAGGLLVGASLNMRPDLFAGVVAEVPFVDVINTMLDTSLPLTTSELEEWGDPRKPDELAYMRSYSPYDNVAAKAYPPMLVRTAYHDSQVMYWEPAKWVAKLRATKTDTNPVVLTIHMGAAGHGGRAGRYDKLADVALTYAWVLDKLGLADR